jgi:hypothetical protein
MATPEDPIRALAERGVLHMPPIEGGAWVPDTVVSRRLAARFPEEGLAKSPLAEQWETAADYMVDPIRASYLRGATIDRNPWLTKLPPETLVNRADRDLGRAGDLGFPHLIDELSNALNPESGLPRHLLLDPKSMSRVSVPQAVERVSAINAWRAAQKAEVDALRANNAATRIHKEYAENNPLGLRWMELKARTEPGDGWRLDEHGFWENPKGVRDSTWKDQAYSELQDALKYEGDTMGHCVGGYCDDVLSGRSRIYSLRDAKGQPHVTIETTPGNPRITLREAMIKAREDNPQLSEDEIVKLADKYLAESADPSRIVQIKGKQNRAPNAEYLPFVQDFVKSGQWSDVGDLRNVGLRRSRDVWNDLEQQKIREAGQTFGEYISPEEVEAIGKAVWGEKWGNFAQGGLVEAMIEQNLDAVVEKQTPKQMSKGGSVRTPIRAKIEKMTSELRQCRN